MIKTREEIKEVREMAVRLQVLGLPQKMVDKICQWAREEARRLRDEARENSH
jgi:hypothetical protein